MLKIRIFNPPEKISCREFRFNFLKAIEGIKESLIMTLTLAVCRWAGLSCELQTCIINQ